MESLGSDSDSYWLASADTERARLQQQAELMRPATERLLRGAGVGPTMRVLDVGAGAGDVALIAGELVGPGGSVLGIDFDEASVRAASARARAIGAENVTFAIADIDTYVADSPFDAVVGRLVLMYSRDPLASIHHLARSVRSGGVVAFLEGTGNDDMETTWHHWPDTPLLAEVYSWFGACHRAAKVQMKVGLRLPAWMRAGGLEPQRIFEATAIVLEGRDAADFTAAGVRSMLPLIQANGIATAEYVDLDTLAERLLAAGDGELVITIGPFTSVWGRKP
jgi:ubiquinone/menaquinone biosynthesis C-methylase UbiE